MNSYQRYKKLGRPVDYLMNCWIRGWSTDPEEKDAFDWACMVVTDFAQDEPEKAWECIMYAIARPEFEPHFGVLAASVLEDLLSFHGPAYIEKVESEAKSNHKFAFLLGGVWRFQMNDEIWERVQKAWDRRGWDSIPRT
jgi:hypothetical protein